MNSILHNATPNQLEQAAAQNHIELFRLNAMVQGGETITTEGLTWTYERPGKGGMISFPALTADNASARLDEMMNYYRAHAARNVGCWSLDPPQPADIGVRLLARGFQPGWLPCWMALDLEKIKTDYPRPAGLEIMEDNDTPLDDIKDLPYAGNNGAVSPLLIKSQPDTTKTFIARLNGNIVGQSCVLLTTGEYGTGGIYNVGVIPSARNQGIGKAVVSAACLYAKEKGYRYAVLNATGRRMYEQVGFKWISEGITWWLMTDRYITQPPSAQLVALAEAVGRGDIGALNDPANHFTKMDLNAPITNGMKLIELAAYYQQPGSGEWLVNHGAEYTPLAAWDMGWKERTKELLLANPEEVNRLYDEVQGTLLHKAAERNDIALAELALSANPDLTICDKIYNGTALGWAEYLGSKKIAEMIRKKM